MHYYTQQQQQQQQQQIDIDAALGGQWAAHLFSPSLHIILSYTQYIY
jgi:hypothetical protein